MDNIGANVIEKIGDNIKLIRKMQGITQKELAGKINISVSHLRHVENNTAAPSLDTLVIISDALKVPLDYLVKGAYAPMDKTALIMILDEFDKIDPLALRWINHALTYFLYFLKYRNGSDKKK